MSGRAVLTMVGAGPKAGSKAPLTPWLNTTEIENPQVARGATWQFPPRFLLVLAVRPTRFFDTIVIN